LPNPQCLLNFPLHKCCQQTSECMATWLSLSIYICLTDVFLDNIATKLTTHFGPLLLQLPLPKPIQARCKDSSLLACLQIKVHALVPKVGSNQGKDCIDKCRWAPAVSVLILFVHHDPKPGTSAPRLLMYVQWAL